MEDTRRVKAAVIGVGLIGEQHAETYQEYPRSELVMVFDRDLDRARAVADIGDAKCRRGDVARAQWRGPRAEGRLARKLCLHHFIPAER